MSLFNASDEEMATLERVASERRAQNAAQAAAIPSPVDEAQTIMDAQDSGRAQDPNALGSASTVDMGNEGISPLEAASGLATPMIAKGPGGALQVEDRLAERMAPGAQALMARGAGMKYDSAGRIGDATSDEEKQVADWYKRNREEQSRMLSRSMTDYQKRRDAIDEFTPKLMEAADRIKNMKGGSFWSDMKDGLAYQSMVAMHLVSDDHLGVAKATQDMVNNQLNKERFELEKARTSYDALNTTLGQFRALAGDAQIGDQLYRKASLETAAMQIEELSHGLKSQTAKDAAAAAQGQILEEAGKLEMQIGMQTFRQGSIQDARLAKYNNDKAAAGQAAQAAKVGAALLKLGGGDPEKAARIGIASGMDAATVTGALSSATEAPMAPTQKVSGQVVPVAAKPAAGDSSRDDAKLDDKQFADPTAWADRTRKYGAGVDQLFNAYYMDKEKKKDYSGLDTGAIALGRGKLLAAGRKAEAANYQKVVGDAAGKAFVGAEEKLDAYVTASALRRTYNVYDTVFTKIASATGKSKDAVANEFLTAGREGFTGSLAERVAAKLGIDPERVKSPLKSAGLAPEKATASAILGTYLEGMKMARAKEIVGVVGPGDKTTAAELASGKYGTWNDFGGALSKAEADGRAAIDAASNRFSLPGEYGNVTTGAMRKAIIRGEIAHRVSSRMRGISGALKGK